jgi:hypothetical protein
MPYTPAQQTARRKKIYKKELLRNRSRRVYRPIGGFKASATVNLRYVQTFTLDPGAANFATKLFRANGTYDPDASGVGHQPSNYDIWTQIYDRYTVASSTCKVYTVKTATGSNIPGVLALVLSEDGNAISSAFSAGGGIDGVLEQPRLSRSIRNLGAQSPTDGKVTCSKSFSTRKFFNTKASTAEPYSADVAADPAEGAFYEVSYISSDNSNNPDQATFRVEITYTIKFTEPKIAVAS